MSAPTAAGERRPCRIVSVVLYNPSSTICFNFVRNSALVVAEAEPASGGVLPSEAVVCDMGT